MSSSRNIVEVKITVHAMFMASGDPLKVAFFSWCGGSTAIGLAPRPELTWVGIKHVIGRKTLHLVVRTDDAPQ